MKRYDWFIVKTGDQGEMTNKGKNKLSNLLLRSNSFKVFKKWNLADNSELILIKRKKLSEEIIYESCKSNQPNILLKKLKKNGFELVINGKIDHINNKNIIIDFKEKNKLLYFSIPEIQNVEKKINA